MSQRIMLSLSETTVSLGFGALLLVLIISLLFSQLSILLQNKNKGNKAIKNTKLKSYNFNYIILIATDHMFNINWPDWLPGKISKGFFVVSIFLIVALIWNRFYNQHDEAGKGGNHVK